MASIEFHLDVGDKARLTELNIVPEDAVCALCVLFGIRLSPEERASIKGVESVRLSVDRRQPGGMISTESSYFLVGFSEAEGK